MVDERLEQPCDVVGLQVDDAARREHLALVDEQLQRVCEHLGRGARTEYRYDTLDPNLLGLDHRHVRARAAREPRGHPPASLARQDLAEDGIARGGDGVAPVAQRPKEGHGLHPALGDSLSDRGQERRLAKHNLLEPVAQRQQRQVAALHGGDAHHLLLNLEGLEAIGDELERLVALQRGTKPVRLRSGGVLEGQGRVVLGRGGKHPVTVRDDRLHDRLGRARGQIIHPTAHEVAILGVELKDGHGWHKEKVK